MQQLDPAVTLVDIRRPAGWPHHRAADAAPAKVLLTEMQVGGGWFEAPGAVAMSGRLYSGTPVDDPRSQDMTCL